MYSIHIPLQIYCTNDEQAAGSPCQIGHYVEPPSPKVTIKRGILGFCCSKRSAKKRAAIEARAQYKQEQEMMLQVNCKQDGLHVDKSKMTYLRFSYINSWGHESPTKFFDISDYKKWPLRLLKKVCRVVEYLSWSLSESWISTFWFVQHVLNVTNMTMSISFSSHFRLEIYWKYLFHLGHI